MKDILNDVFKVIVYGAILTMSGVAIAMWCFDVTTAIISLLFGVTFVLLNKYTPIKIKYVKNIIPIHSFDIGDWTDLRCAENIEMKAGEYRMIPLGVAMQLPKGYEAIMAPRSSTFKKYGVILVNSIGVIDESYCGDNDEWNFLAYAVKDTVIPKNERICQFRIIKHQPNITLLEVDKLKNKDRGGIGSTGRV